MALTLKEKLYERCQQLLTQRIATAKEAMDAAQAAANEESKSSAGDKYETTRAMMQLERDQHARLLAEALKLKQMLDGLDAQRAHERIQAGSAVITGAGRFYVAVSLGKLNIEGEEWIALSPVSPLGAAFLGLGKGDKFHFNKRQFLIEEVR